MCTLYFCYYFQVKLWNLTSRKCIRSIRAHDGYIRGTTFLPDGEHFLSVGDDKTIKIWETDPGDADNVEPTDTVVSKVILFC